MEKGVKAAVIGPRETKRWDLVVDVRNEKDGKEFHLTLEAIYWNGFQNLTEWAGARIDVPMKNASLRILFPRNKTFSRYQLSQFPAEERKLSKIAENEAESDAAHRSLYWNIPEPKENQVYEVQWIW